MNRVKELERKIATARVDYYNGQSTVSDKTYDAWIDELSELDPKNLAVIGIGAEPVSEWEKHTHTIPMGSLNKCQTQEEFVKWHKSYVDADDDLMLTLKLDGLSVSLTYENGVLVRATTRGSGVAGELITPNVARMQGVPLRLPDKITAIVRGEILLSKTNHKAFFADYSNGRNGASGISRRYDGEGSDKLTVLVYQLFSDDIKCATYQEQFAALEKMGFQVPTYYVVKIPEEVLQWRDDYQATLRDQYDFDLDGLVIHNNNLSKHIKHGSHNDRPRASIAYKFDSLHKEGFIKDIIVQVGNSGRLTPVAIFDPKVQLMGAEVEKASLHNFSQIAELGVGIGATVLVCRSNDVIPYVEEVVDPPKKVFQPPTHCPECETKAITTGEYVQCPNTMGCPSQVVGRVANWVKELNILELGDKLITKLVESELVKTPADLYTLTVDELAGLERMGSASAKKVHSEIWKCNSITLDIFLGALSIPMIGGSSIRAIMASGHTTLEAIQELTVQELEAINGIGPGRAKSLAEGLKANADIIDALLENGVQIKEKKAMSKKGKLTGKSFVITGTLTRKRDEVAAMIEEAGGTMQSAVGKGTNFLVIADPSSTSTKAQKARKLGTELISEEQLLAMIEQ